MNATAFNQRVREAARHQRLPGIHSPGAGTFVSRWAVSVEHLDPGDGVSQAFDFGINPLDGKPFFSASVFQHPQKPGQEHRLWQVNVRPGCVNEENACVEYFAQNDPRGWQMPDKYPPYLAAQKIFGPQYPFVDRPLWEEDRPVVLVTAPSADGKDLGGFLKTLDVHRPVQFRTEDAWERDLYEASVLVSITPFKADPAALSLAVGGARARRWRILVGQVPTSAGSGVSGLDTCELARLWLLRTPGKPEDDTLQVQRFVYWDLAARSIIDLPFLELIGAATEATLTADLGLLALSLLGGSLGLSLAVGALGVEEAVIGLLLDNLKDILAATSGVAFWTV